jgi:spermidine synthase
MLLTAAIAWTAYMAARSLPYWPINPSLSANPWFNFQLDLVRCMWAILPPACLWGASFPLALAAVASRGQDPGQLVGGVYAANTVGAIVGAVGFSMVLIGWVGTQKAQRLLIELSAVAALLMFIPPLLRFRANVSSGRRFGKSPLRIAGGISLAAATALAALLARSVPGIPWGLIAYGRYLPSWDGQSDILYAGEGRNASIAISALPTGVLNFHVSGKVEASSAWQDMRLQRMLGHIPALLHPKPRSVLVVGCGAGVTAGTFVVHPDVERIVICEIEPLIVRVVPAFFEWENYYMLDDPRVEVIYDDARHYILTTRDKFDIITSDPINPWVKGAATLYTKEYFDLVKRHLNPGGLVTQWVPLYESKLDAVKSEIATFFQVFPNGTIWSNDAKGEGYDIILLGQAEAMKIVVDELQDRLDRSDYSSVAQSLENVGFRSAVDLLATYAGQGPDLRVWLNDAEINRDRNLRLQYLAGMGLNCFESTRIYDDMLVYRRFPEELFVASDHYQQALRQELARPRSGR